MALTGKNIDLILGLKLNEFFAANKRASVAYSKTKGSIEKKPIRIKEDGAKQLLSRLTQIGAAYIGIRKVFTDLTTSQTNLANIASLGVDNIEEIGKGIQQIALDVPVALHDIEAGMYQVVSAGVDASNQISVLEASARAAKAGLAETTDALNLGAAVIKGYGKDFSEFESVMDQAFQTVKLGQTTFPELASSIGAVVPLASTLKVKTEELFGAFATLTGVTGSTSEVATQLRGILAATAKPTEDLTRLFRDYGGAAAALQKLGLARYLKVIADETGGNTEAMAKLVPRVEGLNAVLALSGEQFDTFVEKTGLVGDATGAMADAFDKQADTLESNLTKLDNSFQIFSQAILSGAVPAINSILSVANDFFRWFSQLSDGSQKSLIALTAFSVILLKLPALIRAVRLAIIGLNASLGPTGWLIAGVSALAAAIIIWTDETNKATTANKELKKSIDDLAGSMRQLINETYETASLEDLIERHNFYSGQLDKEISKLEKFRDLDAPEKMIQRQEQIVRNYQTALDALDDLIEKRKEFEESLKTGGTPAPIESRITPLDPSAFEQQAAKIESISRDSVQRIRDVNLEFNDLTNADLDQQYIHRRGLLDNYLQDLEEKEQTGSLKYKSILDRRLELERNYQKARIQLEAEAQQTIITLGAQLMGAFQGQSQAFFEIGKAAAIAEATVNAYKGASESLAAYPMPFAAIIAAVHVALGLARVAQIQSVQFQKAKGRAAGGYIGPGDLVGGGAGILIPAGEDGLIAAQIGEQVMNRGATRLFGPILNEFNRIGRGKKSYQTGGVVDDVFQPGTSPRDMALILEDAIARGLRKTTIRIQGRFKAKGQDLEDSFDQRQSLKVNL